MPQPPPRASVQAARQKGRTLTVSNPVALDYRPPARTLPPVIGSRHYFLLRRLHSLTGIVFGGYLIVHLLVNATIAQMGAVFQTQVQKIHDLPFLWAFE